MTMSSKYGYFPLKGDGNFAEVIDVCLLFYPPEKASNQRRILFFIAGPLDDEISSYGAEWRGEMFKTNGVAVDLFLFGVPECYTHYKVLKTFVDAANYNGNSHIAHLKVNSQTSPSEILSSAPDIFPLEEEGEITSNKKAKDAKGKNQAAAAAHDEHVKADNHKMNSSKKKRSKRKRDGV
ncbi:uncharacterized protein [Rutidosis leptorrhynchoides]|uniref:uncharacterized protein n=1 Tax=Rutidosis leptorrhynchoides TaxID=125765 RepID=UPI003A996932